MQGKALTKLPSFPAWKRGMLRRLGRCWDTPPADLQDGAISKMRSAPKSGEGLGSAGITGAPSARYRTYFVSSNRIFIFSKKSARYVLKHGDYPLRTSRAERTPTARSVPVLSSRLQRPDFGCYFTALSARRLSRARHVSCVSRLAGYPTPLPRITPPD